MNWFYFSGGSLATMGGIIGSFSVDETVLRTDNLPVRFRHYFNREELYELVWTAPMSEVSMRFGVSDVGFAKLCRRAHVPVPGRGYWARLDAGQQFPRPPLPSVPLSLPALLRIRGKKPILSRTMSHAS